MAKKDLRERVHNNLANAKRMLAGLIVQQKNELDRQKKIREEFQKKYDEELATLNAMERTNNSEAFDAQNKRVGNIAAKLDATNETIAQYEINLRDLNAH